MKKAKKWLVITGNVLLWLFVAFAVVITVLVFAANANDDGIPSIGGKSPITVVTDSMSPTFKSGDMIICDVLTDPEKFELQAGDVITYYVDLDGDNMKEINTHRIVEVRKESGYTYYKTQGDNEVTNPVPDDYEIRNDDVICKYAEVRIAGIGKFLAFLQTSLGFLIVVVLPLLLFFIYELYRFISTLVDFKGKKGVKLTADEEEAIKRRAVEEYLMQQSAGAAVPSSQTDNAGTGEQNTGEADKDAGKDQ